jgi:putative addiction module killer protein
MLVAQPHEIQEYLTADGRSPFGEWLDRLRDRDARVRIRVRLDRVSLGSFGDAKSLGGGLHELRIDVGPGYRVYFGQAASRVVLLLCGGTKEGQARDIEQARDYWQDYRSRS